MTNQQFDALVFRLEALARRNPRGYQLRVVVLAALGNAYLGLVLLLVAATLVGLLLSVKLLGALALKLILVVGVFLWVLLKSLWVNIPAPQGVPVCPAEAPALFALLDALSAALEAPRFHTVLVTGEFNAGVVQVPRLGVFGWHRNYLLIGLPLLKALTVEQFKAVLAHELGHLAKGHGRSAGWIYSQRLRWSRLLEALAASNSRGVWLFKPFLNWYAPYFNAYSFPLARANEYEADATSARLTSPQAAAQALTTVDVVSSYLGERYWPAVYKLADERPQPNFAPYANMGQRVASELDAEAAQRWLKQALARQTTSADTHPALTDRLHALGEAAHLAPPAAGAAADGLLGGALAQLEAAFDRHWQENIAPTWQQRHQEVQQGRRQLIELDAQHASGGELSVQQAFERARLTAEIGDDAESALVQWRNLLERVPEHPLVLYSLGRALLARDDDSGCALIERCMVLDENASANGCEVLRDYAWRQGREAEAKRWHERLVEAAQLQRQIQQERGQISLKDRFEPHGLSAERLAELTAQLRTIPGLRKVYFVKKQVKLRPQQPCFVLGFTAHRGWQWHSKRRVAEISSHIQTEVTFPGETYIINVEGDHYRFGRKFYWMRGARIL